MLKADSMPKHANKSFQNLEVNFASSSMAPTGLISSSVMERLHKYCKMQEQMMLSSDKTVMMTYSESGSLSR